MPKQYRPLHEETVLAAGAITIHRFVGFDGNQASVQGQTALGVSRFAAAAGDEVALVSIGTALVETGGALNPGDPVISDNQGRGIKGASQAIAAGAVAVTSAAANGAGDIVGSEPTEHLLGRVLPGNVAAGAGAFVEILLGAR